MSDWEDSDRETRAARKQTLCRDINERVRELNDGFSFVIERGEWICECADETCTHHLEMSIEEYEVVRQDGTRFFVAPSDEHVWREVERVVERRERYWIVEMFGQAGYMAIRADPRSESRPLPLHT